MSSFLGRKFKTYAYDAAPFFFYIDVVKPDLSSIKVDYFKKLLNSIKDNPIMPIPMRIDRVFNGENSVIIRPEHPIKQELFDDSQAFINPTALIHYGVEKLINYAEVRASEVLGASIKEERTL
ncbi:MAG: hypothetical protein EU550_02750, partial [Promethearchaeota archaeon]